MAQQAEATYLYDLTEVPPGWPLATLINAFGGLAGYGAIRNPRQAREAVSGRLVERWAARPDEARAWLARCRERFATELAGKAGRELLGEALLRHGMVEWGKYGWHGCWRFSQAGLLRGEPHACTYQRERWEAAYLEFACACDRLQELAERLMQAESQWPPLLRLGQGASERRRLEAELQQSQEEGRELRNRLAAAEAEASGKDAELQAAQSESAKCKEQCEEFATRTAAAESATAEMQKELRKMQEEHGKCQEDCRELATRLKAAEAEASDHAKTKELLAQAESDAAEKQSEVQRPQQDESRCCAEYASAEEAKSRVEMQFEKAVLLERCEQLRQQLTKAEGKLGQMQIVWEEKATYKERCRQLERQLAEVKPPHSSSPSVPASLTCQVPVPDAASNGPSQVQEHRASIFGL